MNKESSIEITADMVEEDSQADSSTGFNRRNILKTVGSAGMLATGATGAAAAADRLLQADETRLLTGDEKIELARELSRTSAFRELAQSAQDDGARVRNDSDGIVAGYARGDDFAREIVEYDLAGLTNADEGSIIVGRNPDTNEIEVASLDYYFETDDGLLDEVHRFEPTNDLVKTQVQAAAESDGKRIISVNTEAIRKARDNTNGLNEPDLSEINNVEPQQIEVTGCSACQFAAGQICSLGCSTAGGFICGFLGITVPVAGLSCLGFVQIVCTVAAEYSGCGDAFAEEACDRAGLC